MRLNDFIKKLKKIESKYGASSEVLMADGIPVVDPVYLKNFLNVKAIIITDRKK